uniref:Uncharacterized protein n=1 Tax=Romanomermis culicivorax TaxID=13658 RepID=A0A915I1X9_ROMCU
MCQLALVYLGLVFPFTFSVDYLSKYCNYPIYEDKSKQGYQLDVWIEAGAHRKKYESTLNFNDVEKFVVYTTKIKRTYNSLVALLHGMLGPFRACKIRIKIHDKHTGRVIFCDEAWCQCNEFTDSIVNQARAMDKEIYLRYIENATKNEIDALRQIQQIYQIKSAAYQ